MLFENNIVENCHALLVNDLIRYWSVSGCVRDLTIQNNTFSDMGTGISIITERPAESDVRHKNIRITGNLFRNCGIGISAVCTDDLIIQENRFENVNLPCRLENCRNVICQESV